MSEVLVIKQALLSMTSYKYARSTIQEAKQGQKKAQDTIIAAVSQILDDESSPPIQQLLAVRMVMEVVKTEQQYFTKEFSVKVLPRYEEIAQFNRESKNPLRGEYYFSPQPTDEQSKMGKSFLTIVLESIKVWSQQYPNSAYEESYNYLIQMGVTFPEQLIYYKDTKQVDQQIQTPISNNHLDPDSSVPHNLRGLYREKIFLTEFLLRDRHFQNGDRAFLNETYLNVKNTFVCVPSILAVLPNDLEFFKSYLKDYESFVRQEITYEHLRRTYVAILSNGEKPLTSPMRQYLDDDKLNKQKNITNTQSSHNPKDLDDLTEKLNLATQNIIQYQEQIQLLNVQISHNERQISFLQDQVKQFQRMLSIHGDTQANHAFEIEQMTQEHSKVLEDLRRTHLEVITNHQKHINKLQQELQDEKVAHQDAHKSYSKVMDQSKVHSDQIMMLGNECSQLKQQIVNQKSKFQIIINDLEQKVHQYENQLGQLKSHHLDKEQNIAHLKNQIEEHDKRNNLYVMQINKLQTYEQIIQQQQQQIKDLEKSNSQLIEENIKLRQPTALKIQTSRTPQRIFDADPLTPEKKPTIPQIPSLSPLVTQPINNDLRSTSRPKIGRQEIYRKPTLPTKHAQLIYPYTNPLDYYRDKIRKPSKGQEIQIQPWLPPELDTNYIQMYRGCCLENSEILSDNNYIKIISRFSHQILCLKILNKLQQPMQFNWMIEHPKEMSAKGDLQGTQNIFQPGQVIVINLEVEMISYPLSVATIFMNLNLGVANQRIKTFLPITLSHFFEFVKITGDQFKQKWQGKQIYKSKNFRYDDRMFNSAGDVQKFIGELCLLNPDKMEEFVTGIDELKFGGLWYLPPTGDIFLIKLIFTPLKELCIQVGSQAEPKIPLITQIISIIHFYFAQFF